MSNSRIDTDVKAPPMNRHLGYLCLPGCLDYSAALTWQQKLMAARRDRPDLADVLLLLEHPPVYTLGQGASEEYLKFTADAAPFPVHRIERGGEVTYHGPGQLVGYPILNLRRYRMDLHWYLRQLEEVIIQTLATYGLTADRVPGLTGVWLEGRKLAAIGIKVSRWITMHGFALNVCPDLSHFGAIVPCGIADKPVGSLAQFRPGITIADVQPHLIAAFTRVFGIDWQAISLSDLAAREMAGTV